MSLIKIFNKENILINRKRLEKRIIPSSKEIPDWIDKILDECLEKCTLKPKAVYSFFDFKIIKNQIEINNINFNSQNLATRFKYANELGLFIVTIGSNIGEKAKNTSDAIEMLVYDAIGSEYAESTANTLHKLLEKEKGYCMNRYSPGYGDWDVAEQKKFFSLVSGKEIGVKLTSSFIMQPEKSISAVIGYSTQSTDDCKSCSKTDCLYKNLLN